MGTSQTQQADFDPLEVINSIPAFTLLEELKRGHNTFALLLFTIQGQVIYANDIAVNGFKGHTVDSIKGKSVYDIVPKEWADERIEVFQRAMETLQTIYFIEIIEGIRLCSRIKAIDATINNEPTKIILQTIEPIIAQEVDWLISNRSSYDIIKAQCVDLGKLNALSDRELEVLALMGKGMRQKDIAKELCRSVSTINRHRESIGHKLNMTDRAQIVRLANLAILDVSDASRKRFTLNPDSPARANNDHCN